MQKHAADKSVTVVESMLSLKHLQGYFGDGIARRKSCVSHAGDEWLSIADVSLPSLLARETLLRNTTRVKSSFDFRKAVSRTAAILQVVTSYRGPYTTSEF